MQQSPLELLWPLLLSDAWRPLHFQGNCRKNSRHAKKRIVSARHLTSGLHLRSITQHIHCILNVRCDWGSLNIIPPSKMNNNRGGNTGSSCYMASVFCAVINRRMQWEESEMFYECDLNLTQRSAARLLNQSCWFMLYWDHWFRPAEGSQLCSSNTWDSADYNSDSVTQIFE